MFNVWAFVLTYWGYLTRFLVPISDLQSELKFIVGLLHIQTRKTEHKEGILKIEKVNLSRSFLAEKRQEKGKKIRLRVQSSQDNLLEKFSYQSLQHKKSLA